MNITELDKKILELQEKRKELILIEEAKKNKVDTKNLFKFKDLEITRIIDWDKSYDEIVIPKGFRLIKIQELVEILESDQEDEFLGAYKDKFGYFWCAKNKHGVLRLSRGSSGNWYASWAVRGSVDAGRVVYVKKEVGK